MQRSDWISTGLVGYRVSSEDELSGWGNDSSGERLSLMVFTEVWKNRMKVSATELLSV